MGWLLLAALFLLALCALCANCANCEAADSVPAAAALLELKAGLQDPRGALRSWQPGGDPCNRRAPWAGVTCSGRGEVLVLNLASANLSGTLSPALGRLSTLQELWLSNNALTGELPAEWGRLSNLAKLYLDSNALVGTLPAAWASFASIKYLSAASNHLSGPLPLAWGTMGGGRVYLINLSANKLTGTLPPTWGVQAYLFHLRVANNLLDGALPPEWAGMHRLLTLDASKNRLIGTLPAAYRALSQATLLDVSGNALQGPLPAAWGQLASLQILALQDNALSGLVPPEWNGLAARIYSLNLARTAVCGDLPDALASAIGPAQRRDTGLGQPCPWQADADVLLRFREVLADPLRALGSWEWHSSPCGVPGWRGVTCAGGRVAGLNLTRAGLSGTLGNELDALGGLEVVDLSHNDLASPLPPALAGLQRLRVLDLSHTGAVGPLPEAWAASLPSLTALSLSANKLTGTLPAAWAGMQLHSLDLSANRLRGSLPLQWGALQQLQSLSLAGNELEGPIPASWSRMEALSYLQLSNNIALCGGTPPWRAGTALHLANTNLDQSCLLTQASGLVVGVVFAVSVVASLASCMAIAAILVYLRQTRSTLRGVLRERSMASLASFLSTNSNLALGGGARRAMGTKAAAQALPTKTPMSPTPEEPGSPGFGETAWQLAAYAHDRGQDLLGRRAGFRRLYRTSQSEAGAAGEEASLVRHHSAGLRSLELV